FTALFSLSTAALLNSRSFLDLLSFPTRRSSDLGGARPPWPTTCPPARVCTCSWARARRCSTWAPPRTCAAGCVPTSPLRRSGNGSGRWWTWPLRSGPSRAPPRWRRPCASCAPSPSTTRATTAAPAPRSGAPGSGSPPRPTRGCRWRAPLPRSTAEHAWVRSPPGLVLLLLWRRSSRRPVCAPAPRPCPGYRPLVPAPASCSSWAGARRRACAPAPTTPRGSPAPSGCSAGTPAPRWTRCAGSWPGSLPRSGSRGRRARQILAARRREGGGWEILLLRYGRFAGTVLTPPGRSPMPAVEALRATGEQVADTTTVAGPASDEETALLADWLERPGTRLIECDLDAADGPGWSVPVHGAQHHLEQLAA